MSAPDDRSATAIGGKASLAASKALLPVLPSPRPGPGRGSRVVPPSRREPGLPTSAAVLVAVGAALLGGAIDVLTGPGLRAVFAVFFVVGCVAAAALVRRCGLPAAVVMPPLVYVLVALMAAALQSHPGVHESWLVAQSMELLTALITGAPLLLGATASAAVVAAVRLLAFHGPRLVRQPR